VSKLVLLAKQLPEAVLDITDRLKSVKERNPRREAFSNSLLLRPVAVQFEQERPKPSVNQTIMHDLQGRPLLSNKQDSEAA
jgi:hypothetical protein